MAKRLFDILVSIVGILVLSPLLLLSAILVKLTSSGPFIFAHERAGRHGSKIRVYKFRTMVQNAGQLGGPLTLGGRDPRITTVGHWLRATKCDELPQLFNVLKGDMSFVGPRPEAWKYVDLFRDDFQEILSVRPGITDPASIEFRDEGTRLEQSANPEMEYTQVILPQKIKLSKQYIRHQSLVGDIGLILKTIAMILIDRVNQGHENKSFS